MRPLPTLPTKRKLVKIAKIAAGTCDRSPMCPVRRVCPNDAVYMLTEGPYARAWAVDPDRCTGCGACVRVCPAGAVSLIDHEE